MLAYTPAQWNANHGLLGASKSSEQTAQGALQKGRSDVSQIRQILKSEGGIGADLGGAKVHGGAGGTGAGGTSTTTAAPATSQD